MNECSIQKWTDFENVDTKIAPISIYSTYFILAAPVWLIMLKKNSRNWLEFICSHSDEDAHCYYLMNIVSSCDGLKQKNKLKQIGRAKPCDCAVAFYSANCRPILSLFVLERRLALIHLEVGRLSNYGVVEILARWHVHWSYKARQSWLVLGWVATREDRALWTWVRSSVCI